MPVRYACDSYGQVDFWDKCMHVHSMKPQSFYVGSAGSEASGLPYDCQSLVPGNQTKALQLIIAGKYSHLV